MTISTPSLPRSRPPCSRSKESASMSPDSSSRPWATTPTGSATSQRSRISAVPPRSLRHQEDHPPPSQPRRRPRSERSPLPDRDLPAPPRPTHPRLRRTPHQARPHQSRNHPLPQALHHPRSLHSNHHRFHPNNRLTSIGASLIGRGGRGEPRPSSWGISGTRRNPENQGRRALALHRDLRSSLCAY